MSCPACLDLNPKFLDEATVGQNAVHFIDVPDLPVTSKTCPGCSLIVDALATKGIDCSDDKHKGKSLKLYLAVGRPLEVEYGAESIWLELYSKPCTDAAPGLQALPETIGRAPEVFKSSGSLDSLNLLKSWFETCEAAHALCRTEQDPLLPTRVLDVGESGSFKQGEVKLLETQGARARYSALSYCWGQESKHRVTKTTKSTVDTHKSGIPSASLPLTLQDAVTLTRQLGLRYIWIDALCIIQDDSDDWALEASRMCDIYANSAVTIVACSADGASGGIFCEQRYYQHEELQYLGQPVYIRDNIARDHDPNILIQFRTAEDIDPIHTRAWCFQEAVLSNRAIYFASQELRWECNTCRQCQCGKVSKTYPPVMDAEDYQYEGFRIFRLADFFPVETPADAYERWSYLCQNYCSRQLTKEQDKLVALSGLARQFARLMGLKFGKDEKYLAGIWEGSLPIELLWYSENQFDATYPYEMWSHPKKPVKWRAPSWSWASMDTGINKGFHQSMQSRITILAANTERTGPDPYGQIRFASLDIQGPMLKGIRFVPSKEEDSQDGSRSRSGLFINNQYMTINAVRYQDYDLRITVIYTDRYRIESREAHELLCNPDASFTILVIGYTPSMQMHECLIIESVIGKPQTFERVGLIRLGSHMREPRDHHEAIENAPRGDITLL